LGASTAAGAGAALSAVVISSAGGAVVAAASADMIEMRKTLVEKTKSQKKKRMKEGISGGKGSKERQKSRNTHEGYETTKLERGLCVLRSLNGGGYWERKRDSG
jgi:hypothetical protein